MISWIYTLTESAIFCQHSFLAFAAASTVLLLAWMMCFNIQHSKYKPIMRFNHLSEWFQTNCITYRLISLMCLKDSFLNIYFGQFLQLTIMNKILLFCSDYSQDVLIETFCQVSRHKFWNWRLFIYCICKKLTKRYIWKISLVAHEGY